MCHECFKQLLKLKGLKNKTLRIDLTYPFITTFFIAIQKSNLSPGYIFNHRETSAVRNLMNHSSIPESLSPLKGFLVIGRSGNFNVSAEIVNNGLLKLLRRH